MILNIFNRVSPLKGAYLYQLREKGRWRIGPDYEKEDSWYFTKGEKVEDAQFYTADKETMKIHRSNIAITKLEGMENVYASSVRDSTDSKYKESGRLEKDQRENFIGSWVQIKGKFYRSCHDQEHIQMVYTSMVQLILRKRQYP